jgi:hydroxymethylpyrimidine pyrophosphatase-like HAD family hydrolase
VQSPARTDPPPGAESAAAGRYNSAVQPVRRPLLLGLDLDGTVVDAANEVPAETIAELRACEEAGIRLAFLTGRRPRTAGFQLKKVGLPAYVATNSGCMLWEYPAWQPLRRQLFPADLVQPVAGLLAPYSVNFYVDSEEHGFEFFYLKREHSPQLEEYLTRWHFVSREIADPAEMAGFGITQVAMPHSDAVVRGLRDAVAARYDGRVLALAVRWPLIPTLCLELFHPEGNKGSALQYFAELAGVQRERVAAVGDDVNDLAMLAWAGWGAAMPQAGEETRAAADEVLEGEGAESLPPLLRRLRELPE